jgi:hypothetical protein
MIREPGSSTLMHLRDGASATPRTADARGLVLHALVVLSHPEYRLAIGQGDAYAFLDRLRVFARERENVGQEQFDALVHLVVPPWQPASLTMRFRRGSRNWIEKDYQ